MILIETYLAESPIRGLGLFSKQFVPKGTLIWKFVEGFDTKVHKEKYELLTDIQKKFVDTYFWRKDDYLYSSCDHSNFQNHSNNPNSVETDEGKMVAAKDIYPNEEILVCYESFDDDFRTYENTLI